MFFLMVLLHSMRRVGEAGERLPRRCALRAAHGHTSQGPSIYTQIDGSMRRGPRKTLVDVVAKGRAQVSLEMLVLANSSCRGPVSDIAAMARVLHKHVLIHIIYVHSPVRRLTLDHIKLNQDLKYKVALEGERENLA